MTANVFHYLRETLQQSYYVGKDVTSSHLTLTTVISLVFPFPRRLENNSFAVRMSGLHEVALLDYLGLFGMFGMCV